MPLVVVFHIDYRKGHRREDWLHSTDKTWLASILSRLSGFQATLTCADQDWDPVCPSLHEEGISRRSLHKHGDR